MKEVLTLASTIIILLRFAGGSESEAFDRKVFIDEKGEALLVLSFVKDDRGNEEIKKCQLLTDKASIDEILRSTPYSDVQQTTSEEIQSVIDDCSDLSESKRRVGEFSDGRDRERTTTPAEEETTTEAGYSGIPVILPGTKWCGAGAVAKEIQDLGYHEDTDQCCRAHDLCNDTLAPGETRNNLTNESTFTKLHCRCDDEFYDCLEKADSLVSNMVGNVYFNVLMRGCYTYDHPLGGCRKHRSFMKITCKEYEKNTTAPKTWYWVSARRYKKLATLGPLSISLDI